MHKILQKSIQNSPNFFSRYVPASIYYIAKKSFLPLRVAPHKIHLKEMTLPNLHMYYMDGPLTACSCKRVGKKHSWLILLDGWAMVDRNGAPVVPSNVKWLKFPSILAKNEVIEASQFYYHPVKL